MFHSFGTDNTPECDRRFEPSDKHHYLYSNEEAIISRFSSNSEGFASEFLENLEEMFPCYT